MIPILTSGDGAALKARVMERSQLRSDEVAAKVKEIVRRVREEGDAALFEYTRRFDRAEVTAAAMGGAQTVQAGEGPPRTFPAGQLTTRTFDLDLTPGAQTVSWRRRGPDGAVLVREIRFRPAP